MEKTREQATETIQNYLLKLKAMQEILKRMESIKKLQNFLRFSNTFYRLEKFKEKVIKIENFWIRVKEKRDLKKILSEKMLEIQQKRIIEQEKLKKAKEKLHKDALMDLRRRNFVFAKKFFVSPTKREDLNLSQENKTPNPTVYDIMESRAKKKLFTEVEKDQKEIPSKPVSNKKRVDHKVEKKELTEEEKEVRKQ